MNQDMNQNTNQTLHANPTPATNLENIRLALNNGFGSDQRRIAQAILEVGSMLLMKNRDYGSSAWRRPVLTPNLDAGAAILVRMSDKIERLANLSGNSQPNVAESTTDTLRDLAGYCILEIARPKAIDIGELAEFIKKHEQVSADPVLRPPNHQ